MFSSALATWPAYLMMFPLRFVIQLPNFPVRFFFLYTSYKIHKHIDLLPRKVNLLCNNKRAITMTYKLREINYITNYLKYYLLSIHFSYVDRSNRTITFLLSEETEYNYCCLRNCRHWYEIRGMGWRPLQIVRPISWAQECLLIL